jgi:hypothetical protein
LVVTSSSEPSGLKVTWPGPSWKFGGLASSRPSDLVEPGPAASVLDPDNGIELDFPTVKGGVSLSTRSGPKARFHSLPLTLSIKIEKPVTAYSKGA